VIFDVRGNTGGNSGWGRDIVEVFWGKASAQRVENQFDWTVDWRASKANIAALEDLMQRPDADPDQIRGTRSLRDGMVRALKAHHSYVRDSSAPTPPGPRPPNPVTGKVYFLTDMSCASACLDFADLIRHMPSVLHVGLPTNADSVYMDINRELLPSGLAWFGYGMKVFRHRMRKNNEWYEPQARWPGGEMTDDRVIRWIASLK
jgi:hypothetical protein